MDNESTLDKTLGISGPRTRAEGRESKQDGKSKIEGVENKQILKLKLWSWISC